MRVTGDPRRVTASVVSPKWLVFCGDGFSVQARRERRAYPEVDLQGVSNKAWSEKDCRPLGCAQFGLGFVARRSQPHCGGCSLLAPRHRPNWAQQNTSHLGDTTLAALRAAPTTTPRRRIW